MKEKNPYSQIQVPAKIIFFGEWAVLYGASAVGASVGKYFFTQLEKSSEETLFLESPEAKFLWSKNKTHAPPFLIKAQKALNFVFGDALKKLNGHKISMKRDWLLSEGLGSSSALFLCFLILQEKLKPTEQNPLSSQAIAFKDSLLEFQNKGSGFDLLIQALGGFLSYSNKNEEENVQSLKLKVPQELLLVHTGKKMKTEKALQDFKPAPEFIESLAQSSEKFLRQLDWEKAIQEHHQALSQMGVVPQFVIDLREEWKSKNWISTLKTTGAGGGDTLMLWMREKSKSALIEDITKRGFWIETAQLGVKGALFQN